MTAQAEKKARAEELDLALRRLAEAETAKQLEGACPGTPAKRLAQLQSQLDAARCPHSPDKNAPRGRQHSKELS